MKTKHLDRGVNVVDIASLVSAANQLSVDDRLRLVDAIWDGMADEADALPTLSDAQRAELDRRLAEHEANPNDVVSWDEVRARILSRLSK